MSPVWRVPVAPLRSGQEPERRVLELCRRALGGRGGEQAAAAAAEAVLTTRSDSAPVATFAAALRECRRAGEDEPLPEPGASAPPGPAGERSLAEAVAAELAAANRALPGRQREALALRELLGLPHEEIGRVLAIDVAAVAALLARARLALRDELRGPVPEAAAQCPERERALRALARRQDAEPVADGESDWIREHMAGCVACERAHAAMLEASVCYRAWEPGA